MIQSDITIIGASARTTIIDGGAKYRGFRISSTGSASRSATSRSATRAGGQGGSTDGGGILNASGVVAARPTCASRPAARRPAAPAAASRTIEGTIDDGPQPDRRQHRARPAAASPTSAASRPRIAACSASSTRRSSRTPPAIGGTGGIDSRGGTLNIVILNRVDDRRQRRRRPRRRRARRLLRHARRSSTAACSRATSSAATTVNCDGTHADQQRHQRRGRQGPAASTSAASTPGSRPRSRAPAARLDVLALTAASPAVDRAPVARTARPPARRDQRDMYRPQGPRCDSGAYELDQAPTMTITGGPTGTISDRQTSQFDFSAERARRRRCSASSPARASPAASPRVTSPTRSPTAGLANGSVHVLGARGHGVVPEPAADDADVHRRPTPRHDDHRRPDRDRPTTRRRRSRSPVQRAPVELPVPRRHRGLRRLHLAVHDRDARRRARTRSRCARVDAAGAPDPTPASRHVHGRHDRAATRRSPPARPAPSPRTSATFTYTSTETGSTFQCALDGAAFGTCPAELHRPRARARTPSRSAPSTPPATSTPRPRRAPGPSTPSRPTPRSPAARAAPSARHERRPSRTPRPRAGATFQCALDGAAFARLPGELHRPRARARTPSRSAPPTPPATPTPRPPRRTWTVDTVAPDTTITAGPTGTVASHERRPSRYTSTEAGATFQCALDGAAFARLPGQLHRPRARAAHLPGPRRSTPPATSTPTPAIADAGPSTPSRRTRRSPPVRAARRNDHDADVHASPRPRPARRSSAASTAPPSPPARRRSPPARWPTARTRSRSARSTPPATSTPRPASQTFMVDTTAPNTTLTAGPGAPNNDTTPTFTFTSEAGATFQCRVDAAAFASCTSPFTTVRAHRRLAHLRGARDRRRRQRRRHARLADLRDRHRPRPNTTITDGPGARDQRHHADVHLHGLERHDLVPVPRRRRRVRDVHLAVHHGDPRRGQPHRRHPRAQRRAARPTPSPATRDVRGRPDGAGHDDHEPGRRAPALQPQFTFTLRRRGREFECKLDAAAFAACTSPQERTAASATASTPSACGPSDTAGNVDATPAAVTFVVDTSQPPAPDRGRRPVRADDRQPRPSFTLLLAAGRA